MALSHMIQPALGRPPFPHAIAALQAAVASAPDRTALGYLGRALTYDQVARMAAAAADAFAESGLRRGDRMIVQLQNVPQFAAALLGAWSRGIVVVPVSPMYRAPEVRKVLADSGSTAILTAPALWAAQGAEIADGSSLGTVFLTAMEDFAAEVPARLERFREAVDQLPEAPGRPPVDLSAVFRKALESAEPVAVGDGASADEPALLAYTSGTTGAPKGAVITHRNLMEQAWGYGAFNEVLSPTEVHLCIAPLVHITGIGVSLMSWLLSAGTMILGYRFHPEQALEDIEAWSATWTTGAATAFISLLAEAETSTRVTSSLCLATAGGAAVPTAVLRRFRRQFGFNLLPGFGMTETSGSIASTPRRDGPKSDPETGVPAAGVIHPGMELSVVDPEGRMVERGERGELCVKGPAVISGYWNQPEATADTITDGWLHTGDIGFMDEEGWFYLVDRMKNMINASGYKVWPREVEEVIAQLEDVVEVAVVGVPHDYRGETVKAYVTSREGSVLAAADVIAHCRSNLAAYKVPSEVAFLDGLPKNANGKILHRDLRAMSAATAGA